MRAVLLGPPGAGKGTQARQLAQAEGLAHVASGDLFRKHQAEGTELGKLAQQYMDRGQLVPDEVTIQMVLERIGEPDAVKGYILDGFPRTMVQAQALDESLALRQEAIDRALLIEVSDEELVRRLAGRWLCGSCQTPYHLVVAPPRQEGRCDRCGGELVQRADDRPEVVRRRVRAYEEQTAPVIDHYRRQDKLRRVNGEQGVEEVARELQEALKP